MTVCFQDHVDSDAIGVSYSYMTTSFFALEDNRNEHPAIVVHEYISLASARCLLMYLTLLRVFKHSHEIEDLVHIDKNTTYVKLKHSSDKNEDKQ